MASEQQTIDPDTPITKIYKDYMRHLKIEHPKLYDKVKETLDWYRPPVRPA